MPQLTFLLAFMAMIGPFATDTFLPSLPAIAHHFAVSQADTQLLLSVYLVTFASMCLFYGTLSDSFGRRPVVLVAMSLFALGSVGASMASSFHVLLICRGLQGFSAGAGATIGQAVIRDRFSGLDAQRLMSHITVVFAIGPILAPIVGGQLQVAFGWRAAFYFMTVYSGLLILFCYLGLKESLPVAQRSPFHPGLLLRNYWQTIRHRKFVSCALAISLSFAGTGLYIASAASFIIALLHLKETSFGWLFIPMMSGMVLGSLINTRLTQRLGQSTVMRLGFSLMALAAATNFAYCMLAQISIPWAVLPILFYSLGQRLVMPLITMQTLDIFPQRRGMTASVIAFMQMLIFAIVSGIVAPLLFDSALKLASGMLACAILALLCWCLGGLHTEAKTA